MKVLVSGASGLIGRSLASRLEEAGHDVSALVRRAPASGDDVLWDPARCEVVASELEGFGGVVHLAGEGVADGRWTRAKMRRIHESRVQGTRCLSEALAGLERRPGVLVCASAIGFYGDRDDEDLDERSEPGSGFLAEVCRDWEDACAPARSAGIRVVSLRIGVVLSKEGGALAKMLLPFRLGLAGRIGSGRQWMSWIEVGDVVDTIRFALETDSLRGPVNAVAPEPVTNADYTRTLGRVLSRPTLLPMPAAGARLAFGRMADELLLASIRARPRALLESGFEFEHPELEGALRSVLAGHGG